MALTYGQMAHCILQILQDRNNCIMLGGFHFDLCNASQPAAASPVNSALPVISGTAQEGQTLTTTNATWTQAPTSYAYQWYYSD
jgi:hypothetical protein